jgi:hypothetical protein
LFSEGQVSSDYSHWFFPGFFPVLITGLLEFYGQINEIPIDPNYPLFFLYIGFSHILFGVLTNMEKALVSQRHEMSKQ